MKKLGKWLYLNKKPMSGMLALVLYFIDNTLDITDRLCLSPGWYYSLIAILFVGISYSINGEGMKGMKVLDKIIEEEKELMNSKDLSKNIETVHQLIEKIVDDKNEVDEEESNNSE